MANNSKPHVDAALPSAAAVPDSTVQTPAPAANTAAPVATPENTPVPGGGRWTWDAALAGWADVPEPAAPSSTPSTSE